MRGGKRQGSGRKKGAVAEKTTRRTQAALAALESGVTPLDVMLQNMRWAMEQVNETAKKTPHAVDVLAGFRKMAQDAAVDAAPYVHPKLAAIQHSGDEDSPLTIVIRRSSDA